MPNAQSVMEIFMTNKTYKVGRSAKSGQFTSVKKAQRFKTTHVVETMKKTKGK